MRWDTCLNNMRDKYKHGTDGTGEKHSQCRLTEEQVLEIRDLCVNSNLRQWQIAKKYNLKQATVSDIYRRKLWKHI